MKKLITFLSVLALLTVANSKISAQTCAANFSWTVGANGVVNFTSTSAPTTSATMYYWSFGNGTTYTNVGVSGQTTSTTYSANGVYTVNLFFITIPTCSNAVTYTIAINSLTTSPCGLTANFNYTQGSNGLINFNNTTTNTITGVTYSWNFGDGSPASSMVSGPHTYAANGNYIVTLVATNNGTCVSTKTLNIAVSSYCNIVASFTTLAASNGSVLFSSTSTGTVANSIHIWNFGDGSPNVIGGPFVSHTYVNGTYPAVLTVMNSSLNPACSDTAFATVAVTNATCFLTPNSANFTYTVGANGSVNVTNTSTGTLPSTTYNWNFGNGFFSNAANPSTVTYPSSGIYNINLSIGNGVGCGSSVSKTVNVTGIPCAANASFSFVPSGTPQLWYAIPAFMYNVTNASWSWGDSSPSTNTLFAAHQYSVAGNYNICLTVTASCGATASSCATYSVYRGSAASAVISVNVQQPTLKNLETSNTVGLTELAANVHSALYPNPSTGLFNVSASGLLSDNATITVYNSVGQVLFSGARLVNNGNLTADISLEDAKAGIYFVKIEAGDKSVVNKLVISK